METFHQGTAQFRNNNSHKNVKRVDFPTNILINNSNIELFSKMGMDVTSLHCRSNWKGSDIKMLYATVCSGALIWLAEQRSTGSNPFNGTIYIFKVWTSMYWPRPAWNDDSRFHAFEWLMQRILCQTDVFHPPAQFVLYQNHLWESAFNHCIAEWQCQQRKNRI